LKGAGSGQSADQSEVNAAIGRSTRYFSYDLLFTSATPRTKVYIGHGRTSRLHSAAIALRENVLEMEEAPGKKITSKNVADIVEAEIVEMNENVKRKVKIPPKNLKRNGGNNEKDNEAAILYAKVYRGLTVVLCLILMFMQLVAMMSYRAALPSTSSIAF